LVEPAATQEIRKNDFMEIGANRHASEDLLEQYSMGRLAEPEIEEFESHLLMCAYCQDALASTEAYVKGMRGAAREWRQSSAASCPWYRQFFDLSKPAWVLGMVVLALLIAGGAGLRLFQRAGAPPALVLLQSTRGAAPNSSAPAGKPLTLALDLTDLQALPRFKVEIVDAVGVAVFQSLAAPAKSSLHATIGKGLPAGDYYVRLYTPGGELLREYGLKVRD
jgi:hypothetical protein